MMKTMISMLLSLAMLLCVGMASAQGDDAAEAYFALTGRIVEAREDGSFLVLGIPDGQETLVLVDEETVQEAAWQVGEGDVVTVIYDGRMTHSLPPQIMAQVIRSYSLEGPVEGVDAEGNRVLVHSPEIGEVWMTLPSEETAEAYADMVVRVFFNGVMALSLPAQATAFTIEQVFLEEGTVEEIDTDFFLMSWGESQLRVNFDSHTKVSRGFETGDTVHVVYSGMMTRSMPGQIHAMVVMKVVD